MYYFAGSFVAATAVLLLGVLAADRAGLFEGGLRDDHLHSLGKFLFAFVCFWGYIALIEGLVARIKAEWGKPMTVIGTGGVASLFHGATASIDHFDPDLTIRGMLEIYRRNAAKA